VTGAWDRAARAHLARLDRRGFLRLAGAIAATGVLPTGCADPAPELRPPPDAVLGVLSPRAYATFQAVALRQVGPRGAEVIRAGIRSGRLDPARDADAWIARVPALAGPLQQGLWLLEWGISPLVAKWRPFTALDGAAQDRVLEDLMRSRLDLKRDLFKGLKSLVMLTFYSNAASREVSGHPGPFDAAGIALAMADLGDAPSERR
jgi:hypothetical protein